MTTTPQSPAIAIPDAMVEAAAKAECRAQNFGVDIEAVWGRLTQNQKADFYATARTMLTAALTPEFLRQIVAEQVAEPVATLRRIASSIDRYDDKELRQWVKDEAEKGITAMRSAADQPQEGGK